MSTVSISPSSRRCPRSFTWLSERPRYTITPRGDLSSAAPGSISQAARSPVRYTLMPLGASCPNAEAVACGLFTYPWANCTPERYSSPVMPGGTGRPALSRICVPVFHTGSPMGMISRSGSSAVSQNVTSTAASVGPYRFSGYAPSTRCAPSTWSFCRASPEQTR